jgi:predicted RNA-binding protein YlxR (DUF448 family)
MTEFCRCGENAKFKIVYTHGRKSRGYKVCKNCKKIINAKKRKLSERKK